MIPLEAIRSRREYRASVADMIRTVLQYQPLPELFILLPPGSIEIIPARLIKAQIDISIPHDDTHVNVDSGVISMLEKQPVFAVICCHGHCPLGVRVKYP